MERKSSIRSTRQRAIVNDTSNKIFYNNCSIAREKFTISMNWFGIGNTRGNNIQGQIGCQITWNFYRVFVVQTTSLDLGKFLYFWHSAPIYYRNCDKN